jgi:hypothetical protein
MLYTPSPTALRFFESRKFVKLICGPVGGGKSTAALMALWTMAVQQQAFGKEQVRRTKFAILRNTSATLKQTVKPLIDYWFVTRLLEHGFPALGTWNMTTEGAPSFEIRAKLQDGTIVHTQFVMMHADTPDDVRRLLSAEYSAAWVEEAREIDGPAVFEGLQGRVARFPNRQSGGVTYPCVICSTNAPPVGTYWHTLMTDPPENAEIFMQPPALLDDGSLNPEAENLENLDPHYYDNLLQGKTSDWVAVYLRNKFGAGGLGQPVFKGTFRMEFHVAKSPLKPVSSNMKKIVVGSDNGLKAAAVICQEDAKGRVNLLRDAFVPKDETMGYDRFLETLLVPQLRDLNVPFQNVIFVVDPACFQRSQANEVTIAQIISRFGFQVFKAPTNLPERRIAAVEGLLMRQVDGGAGFLFSPEAGHAISAMEWGYRNRKTATGQGLAMPEKDWFSNVADAIQYAALYFNVGAALTGFGRPAAKPIVRRDYAYS